MKKILVCWLMISVLGGCDFFKRKSAGDLSETSGKERRSIATSDEAREMFNRYDQEIQRGRCSAEVQHRINLYRAERSWTRGPAELDGSTMYLSPTGKYGRWVGVRKYQNEDLEFSVLTPGRIEIYKFSPTCSFTKDVRERNFTRAALNDGLPLFTDDDLEELIPRHMIGFGVIYVWSPGMAYSYTNATNPDGAYNHVDDANKPVSGIKNAHEAALEVGKQLGMSMGFIVLVDPFSRRESIQRAFDAGNHDLKPEMLRRMAAFDLQMRSMGQHFPSVLVYGNGKIFRQMKPGLSTAATYRKFIEGAVKALQQP